MELIYLILQGGLYTCVVCEWNPSKPFQLLAAFQQLHVFQGCQKCMYAAKIQNIVQCIASQIAFLCRLHVRLPKRCGQILLGKKVSHGLKNLCTLWECLAANPADAVLLQFMLFTDMCLIYFTFYVSPASSPYPAPCPRNPKNPAVAYKLPEGGAVLVDCC